MRTAIALLLSGLTLSFVGAADDAKGTTVKLDSLTSVAPYEWKSQKPANRLRSHQFALPGFKDAKDAELAIFPDVGSFEKELPRWKPRFVPPEGKSIDDISKTERFKVGKSDVALWDVTGTWLFKAAPQDPKSKEEVRPDSRVIFVIFNTGDSNYLIRLSGPATTVSSHHMAFMQWLKAFK